MQKPLDSGIAIGSDVTAPAVAKLAHASIRRSGATRVEPLIRDGQPHRQIGPRYAAPVAALDLGTNNCRLLVARRAGMAIRIVDAFSRIVRLGEGLIGQCAVNKQPLLITNVQNAVPITSALLELTPKNIMVLPVL